MRVLVFGTFDNLHPGHHFLLQQAESRGELFIVVARDETVQKIKGKTPHQTQKERMAAIQVLFPSAQVILGDAKNYASPIQQVQPELVVLGYDQQLPPGVTEKDFLCPVERLKAHKPDKYKSSILRSQQ